MKVRVLGSAAADHDAGQLFYRVHGAEVERHFLRVVFAEVDNLKHSAGCHLQVGPYYRVLTRPFSHALYYRIIDREVVIYRVLDCRRDPRCVPTGTQRASPASTSVEARDCLLLSRIPAGSPNS